MYLSVLFSLSQFHQFAVLTHNMVISLVLYMRHAAAGTVLDAVFQISVVAAAVFAQCVKRAVAEEAVESFRMLCRMAREKFALLVLGEFIVFSLNFVHFITLHNISGHGNRVRALIIVPFILFVNYL